MTRHRGRGPLADEGPRIARAVAGALAAAVVLGTGLGWALLDIASPERPALEQHHPARSPTSPGGAP